MDPIRVLIACPDETVSLNLTEFERDGRGIEIIGRADTESEAAKGCSTLLPDVLILDVDSVEGDAFQLTKRLTLEVRQTAVIFVSSSEEPEDLRRAMLAGAEEYLIKPTDGESVASAIFDVIEVREERAGAESKADSGVAATKQGKVIMVTSGKGGLGKTTLAVNLAACLCRGTEGSVALVGLESGDCGVLLNINPKHSIAELSSALDEVDAELLEGYGLKHDSGITLFTTFRSSTGMETALVTVECALTVIELLKQSRDYVVVDTPFFQTPEEVALVQAADDIICVTSSWDLLAVRNTKMFLNMVPDECQDRLRVVINRADRSDMIRESHVQKTLGQEIAAVIRNDAKIVPKSINVGLPFVLGEEGSPVAQDITQLTRLVSGAVIAPAARKRKSFKLFG